MNVSQKIALIAIEQEKAKKAKKKEPKKETKKETETK